MPIGDNKQAHFRPSFDVDITMLRVNRKTNAVLAEHQKTSESVFDVAALFGNRSAQCGDWETGFASSRYRDFAFIVGSWFATLWARTL